MSKHEAERRRSGGAVWFWAPLIVIFFAGAALSVGAYFHSDTDITIVESIAAGYVGVAAMIFGLFAAFFGLIMAGGAIAFSLFLVASPVLVIILLFLLLRKNDREKAASTH
jgi:drug/metabolite transporter (DMT)-like permease